MQTSLERAWQEWEAFCADTLRRAQESVATGLPPPSRDNHTLRAALAELDTEHLAAFLDDPRLAETYFALLLCYLPPQAALPLAQRYDDPCRAKSNLPPRARLTLFLTFRWKQFLLENLRRDASVLSLQAHRFHLAHFVNRFGDEASKALLTTNDPPALARELAKAQKQLPTRLTQP
jgi:hypothetical protein